MDDCPLILFDGVCNLCNWLGPFVARRQRGTHFQLAPLQSPTGQEALARFNLPLDFDSMVLVVGASCFVRSDAVLEIFRRLAMPWPILSLLRFIPRPLRDGLYRFVAANRYRWFGRASQCSLNPGGTLNR